MARRGNRRTSAVHLSRRTIDHYQSLVDRQAERASDYIGTAVAAYMDRHPEATVAETREFVVQLMQAALPNFTELAETLSCDFMEELCDQYGWHDVRPTIHDTTDYEKVERRIHYLASHLANGDEARFKREVTEVTRYFVRRSAQDNMVQNCKDADVRYARVPSGLETCAFCFMLSSRGFVYHNEATAGRMHEFHPNCDCTIVPGAKGRTKIDGYDPETMHENWKACRDALGGTKQLEEDWKNLPPEERADWAARHPAKYKGDTSSAKQAYMENRIMREVETRDWHWLYTGEEPRPQGLMVLDLVDSDAIQEQSDRLYKALGVEKDVGTERWAMECYTRNWYSDMNARLRGQLEVPRVEGATVEDIDLAIAGVDAAMARFDLRTDTVAFRGDSAKWYEGWEVGTEHGLAAYFSTAINDVGAKAYYRDVESRGEEPVMIEVRVPRGTMSVYIGSNTDVTVDKPDVENEHELLLAHGLRYLVLERDHEGKRMVLEVLS